MKKVLHILLLIMLMFVLLSCRQTRYVPVEKTVVETINIVDTLVQTQLVPYRDSIATSDTVSYLRNAYGASWARWSNGLLCHSLFIFPQNPIFVEVPRTVIKTVVTEPKIVEVEKKLSFYQKVCIKFFPFLIFATVLEAIPLVLCIVSYVRKRRKGE